MSLGAPVCDYTAHHLAGTALGSQADAALPVQRGYGWQLLFHPRRISLGVCMHRGLAEEIQDHFDKC